MTMNCETLQGFVKEFSLIRQCDIIQNGMLRMATLFKYPDGAYIDVFLGKTQELLSGWVLTDLGQTTAYLLDLNIKPWTTKRRKQIVSDICKGLEVEQDGGEFKVAIAEDQMADLPQAIVRLSQACIRCSDLVLTQRFRMPAVFKEELEEFVEGTALQYESAIILPGQYGWDIPIDFQVHGRNVNSLIQTLSTINTVAAHGLSNEVFRRWYDLSTQRVQYQFLTVYDTNSDVFRDDDLARLGSVSTVFGFPAHQEDLSLALGA